MKATAIPAEVWKMRELIKQFTLRDLELRYKGSYLGVFWSLLNPLFMLAIYSFVFTQIFKAKWNLPTQQSEVDFALLIFTGMIVFQIFSEPVVRSAGIIASYPNLIKKVVFPAEVLPISLVLSGLINSLLAMVVLILAVLISGQSITLNILFLPLVFIPLLLFTQGIAFFVSVLGVFLRDMGNIVSIVVNAVYFLSPVFYPVSAVPLRFQGIMRLNPLTDFIENTRNVILFGKPPLWSTYGYELLISLMVFTLGYLFFTRNKELFADVL